MPVDSWENNGGVVRSQAVRTTYFELNIKMSNEEYRHAKYKSYVKYFIAHQGVKINISLSGICGWYTLVIRNENLLNKERL